MQINIREHFSSTCNISIIFDNDSTIIVKPASNSNIRGLGKFLGKDGTKYEGEFKDSEFKGFGIYSNGEEVYKGEWNNNLREGFGLLFQDGE